MKYLLMIYGNQEKWDAIPAESWPQEIAKQDAWNKKYHETGELLGGYGLADAMTARLVRRKDGAPVVTDGPYLESKEYIAGFWVIEAPDLDVALKVAADGSKACNRKVEVRPFASL